MRAIFGIDAVVAVFVISASLALFAALGAPGFVAHAQEVASATESVQAQGEVEDALYQIIVGVVGLVGMLGAALAKMVSLWRRLKDARGDADLRKAIIRVIARVVKDRVEVHGDAALLRDIGEQADRAGVKRALREEVDAAGMGTHAANAGARGGSAGARPG